MVVALLAFVAPPTRRSFSTGHCPLRQVVHHMTLTLSRRNLSSGMNSVVLANSIAIDNMDAIKLSNTRPNKPQVHSFRTLGETAMLSETSSTISSENELEDIVETEEVNTRKPITKTQPAPRRRFSILKPSNEEIPISLNGKAFKQLPPPDMDKIKRSFSVSTATASKDRPRLSRHNNVGFSSVVIREYNQTIGDNPSVSYGPPISLDWEYTQLETVSLEHYEAHRQPRRTLRQMCMNYYTRRNVLTFKFGYDEKEVKAAAKQADKCKRERALTKYFLPYSKVEDLVTSAGRKAKRVVAVKKQETV